MFTSKKLKDENSRLKVENSALASEVNALKNALNTQQNIAKENITLTKINTALENKVLKLKDKISAQEKGIRKQTEADLLLNALQAVGIVPAPVPKVDHFERGNELQASLNQYYAAAQRGALSPASLGDSLFGGGFFGGGRHWQMFNSFGQRHNGAGFQP